MQDVLHTPAVPAPLPLYRGKGLLSALGEIQDDPLATLSRAAALGDLVELDVPWKRVWLVNSPALAEEVLITKQKRYGKITRGYAVMRRLLLGNGLLTADGDFWLKQRRTAQPAFHRDRIKGFGETMVALSEACADAWAPFADAGAAFDLHAEMMALTLRIATVTLLSKDVTHGEAAAVGTALTEVVEQLIWRTTRPWSLPLVIPTPANRRFKDARDTLDAIVNAIIDERLAGEQQADLLGMLIEARDPDTGEGMSKQQLRDEVMTMFLAGHETTANALSWTFWLLARHPEIAAKVEAEVDTIAGRPTFEDVPKLGYLSAVLKESLRLYPPAWLVARGALEDDVLGSQPIEKGTFVFVSPYLLHRREKDWHDADAFRPERWLEPSERHRLAYLPFIAGPRKCIGDTFALMEATLVIAVLLQRYRFVDAPNVVTPDPVVTLRPKHGLPVRIARRR